MDKFCPTCGTFSMTSDSFHGDNQDVCSSCGIVDQISRDNIVLSDGYVVPSGKPGKKLSSPMKAHYMKTTEYKDLESSHCYRVFIANFQSLCASLSLPSEIRESALSLAKDAYRSPNIRHKQSKIAYIAACICLSAEIHNKFIAVDIICNKIGKPKHKVVMAKRLITKTLDLTSTGRIDHRAILSELCSNFSLDGAEGRKVLDTAVQLDNFLCKVHTVFIPNTVFFAALICISAESERVIAPTSAYITKLCGTIGIRRPSFLERLTLIRKSLLIEAKKVPWCPSTLEKKQVSYFLQDIIKYSHTEAGNDSDSSDNETAVPTFYERRTEKLLHLIALKKSGNLIQKSVPSANNDDGEKALMSELLAKGCTVEDIKTKSCLELAQTYFSEGCSGDDIDITDQEIDALLYTKEEVIDREKVK